MTEAEWLACEEPRPMIQFLRGWVSDRRLRLFGCACYLNLWIRFPVAELYRDVLRASEAYADQRISKSQFKLSRKKGDWEKVPCVTGEAWEVAQGAARDCSGESSKRVQRGDKWEDQVIWERPEETVIQVGLIRCIFGNPFRPVPFSPAWRTCTVLALASQMYDLRDFSAMPILADALQDAGCDRTDVLDHCRGAGPHARGCRVVDQVLGKE
ncbi:Uncharacterized protein (Fragment) OS=uncultured bacterium PE=4 SV=1 [Gemmata massiliana]|uniref:Uncharacterized protein n=1 Tax=Gemmata massiliana TaxID=1210884 RepID=A0A6P2CZ78_9BACT